MGNSTANAKPVSPPPASYRQGRLRRNPGWSMDALRFGLLLLSASSTPKSRYYHDKMKDSLDKFDF